MLRDTVPLSRTVQYIFCAGEHSESTFIMPTVIFCALFYIISIFMTPVGSYVCWWTLHAHTQHLCTRCLLAYLLMRNVYIYTDIMLCCCIFLVRVAILSPSFFHCSIFALQSTYSFTFDRMHTRIHIYIYKQIVHLRLLLLHSISFELTVVDCSPFPSFFFSLTHSIHIYTHDIVLLRLRLARSVTAHRRCVVLYPSSLIHTQRESVTLTYNF